MPPRVRTAAGTGTPSTAPGLGTTARAGRRGVLLGDEKYLWLLVLLEVALTAHLRNRFRSAHGG